MNLYNAAEIAALCSQLAGVLAGLAFAALLLYIAQTQAPKDGAVHVGVVVSLVVALVSLMICAILYATTTGFPNLLSIVFLTLTTPAFGLSVMLLFLAIAFALHRDEYKATALIITTVVTVVIPVITTTEAVLGALTIEQTECQGCGYFSISNWHTSPATWGWGAIIMVLAATVILKHSTLGKKAISAHDGIFLRPARFVLLVTLIEFALNVIMSFTAVNFRPSNWVLVLYLFAVAAVMIICSFLCIRALKSTPLQIKSTEQ